MPLIGETGSRLRLIKSAPFHRLPPASGRRREEDAASAAEGESTPGLRRRRHVAPPRDRDRRLPSGPLGTEEDHRRVARGAPRPVYCFLVPGECARVEAQDFQVPAPTSTESRLRARGLERARANHPADRQKTRRRHPASGALPRKQQSSAFELLSLSGGCRATAIPPPRLPLI
jgi:hypothetical protein